jgi:hypothetical protein
MCTIIRAICSINDFTCAYHDRILPSCLLPIYLVSQSSTVSCIICFICNGCNKHLLYYTYQVTCMLWFGDFQVTSSSGAIVLVKWYDNRPVTLASNFIGVGAVDDVRRWDKSSRSFVMVRRPEIVNRYNTSMGGVDKLDQLISLYRTFIKSRKWTLRMICHAFQFVLECVRRTWMIYWRFDSVLLTRLYVQTSQLNHQGNVDAHRQSN